MTFRPTSRNLLRFAVLFAGYSVVSLWAFWLAYELRFDFSVPPDQEIGRNGFTFLVLAVQLAALAGFRQFGSLLTYFSVPDLARILAALTSSNVVLAATWYLTGGQDAPPRGVILADFVFAVAGVCFFRLALRLYRERYAPGLPHETGRIKPRRVVILGAGDVGARLAQEASSRPRMGLVPVCFLDDDESKHGRRIHGVAVVGTPEELVKIAAREAIDEAIIAMPSASAKRIREIVQLAQVTKIKVETVPSMAELTSGRVQVSKIRPVDVEDLLGRDPAELDSEGIRNSIQGHVVLVTGAGGSIGSELCRQIAALAPKQLLLVEQAEGALFQIEQELNELGLSTVCVPLVGDILDEERMRYIFAHYHPEVVFHAAAHKHVYMMERQPAEAIRNNVLGTRLLAEVAVDHGVDRFVMISTDKAINPTNVMGATKRLAELQVLAIAAKQRSRADAATLPPSPSLRRTGNASSFAQPTEDGQRLTRNAQVEAQAETHEAAAAILAAVSHTGASARKADTLKTETLKSEAKQIGFGAAAGAAKVIGSQLTVIGLNPPKAEAGPTSLPSVQTGQSPTQFLQEEAEGRLENAQRSSIHADDNSEHLNVKRSELDVERSSRGRRATKFMAVRFGNVLGSSGSVIPIFKRQIANGGPVTVTHPDVTRYFMTIPEAVGLVMQASILGRGGEIFVLDMGRPVKIIDLARQMIELSGFRVGDDIEIKFTGLKPGEKLFEELQHKNEQHSPTDHPRIMRFTPTAAFSESGVQELKRKLYELDSNQLKALLKRMVPEYSPHLE